MMKRFLIIISLFFISLTAYSQVAVNDSIPGSKKITISTYFVGDRRPVDNVSWYDCQEFISRLNHLTGKTFRLPTEAEWEYAARGGINK